MPIPAPTSSETLRDFIARCMGDDAMVADYPRTDQRYAVCVYKYTHRNSPQRVEGSRTPSQGDA